MVTRKGATFAKNQELQWQAERDADAMAKYQEILGDKTRMNRAVKIARERAADLTKRANAMQSVAGVGKTAKNWE